MGVQNARGNMDSPVPRDSLHGSGIIMGSHCGLYRDCRAGSGLAVLGGGVNRALPRRKRWKSSADCQRIRGEK